MFIKTYFCLELHCKTIVYYGLFIYFLNYSITSFTYHTLLLTLQCNIHTQVHNLDKKLFAYIVLFLGFVSILLVIN